MATVTEATVDVLPNEPEANKLFRMVMKFKGSDLHLKVGMAPAMRLAGVLRQMQLPPLSSNDMERLMFPLLNSRQKTILEETGGVDFAHIIYETNGDETRFRVNLFRQRGRLSLVARRVNTSIPDFEGLGLPPVMGEIASHDQGIIILAGVTGSGKSTTIAAMLNYVNPANAAISSPSKTQSNSRSRTINASSISARWASTSATGTRRSSTRSGKTRTSSWSAKCVTAKHSTPPCTPPRPATWSLERSTPRPLRRRLAVFSTSSPWTCTRRCAKTSLST